MYSQANESVSVFSFDLGWCYVITGVKCKERKKIKRVWGRRDCIFICVCVEAGAEKGGRKRVTFQFDYLVVSSPMYCRLDHCTNRGTFPQGKELSHGFLCQQKVVLAVLGMDLQISPLCIPSRILKMAQKLLWIPLKSKKYVGLEMEQLYWRSCG